MRQKIKKTVYRLERSFVDVTMEKLTLPFEAEQASTVRQKTAAALYSMADLKIRTLVDRSTS